MWAGLSLDARVPLLLLTMSSTGEVGGGAPARIGTYVRRVERGRRWRQNQYRGGTGTRWTQRPVLAEQPQP